LVKEIVEEKNKLEKKYFTLLDDVKKFLEQPEQNVVGRNLAEMKENSEEQKCALLEFLKVQANKEFD
jgi:hypothetical protein